MKTKVYYLVLLVLTPLLSSCKSTTEDMIQNEFENYMQANFDDPKDVKEIVSIKKDFYVNSDSIIAKLEDGLALGKSYDDHIDSLIKNKGKVDSSRWETPEFDDFFMSNMTLAMRAEGYKTEIEEFISKKKGGEKVDLDIYIVKYRIKVDDSLKLKEIYAFIDNNKDNISFHEEANEYTEFDEYTYILEIGRKYLKDVTKHSDEWLCFYGYK